MVFTWGVGRSPWIHSSIRSGLFRALRHLYTHWSVSEESAGEKSITLRRKNTDTFASVCSKMAIFKRPENYPKDMQNSLSFHLLIGHIGEASEWVLVTKFPVVLKIRAVKVRPFHFYFIKQVFFAFSTLTGCKISASENFWTKTLWEAFPINARSNRWKNEEICIF